MTERFTRQEVESVVREALQGEQAREDRFTQAEVETAALEVGVSPEGVREAVEARKRREAERLRLRGIFQRSIVAAASFQLSLLLVFFSLQSWRRAQLLDAYEAVVAARSNVEQTYQQRSTVPLLMAEVRDASVLAGATERVERRIYVARRDYNTTASAYNQLTHGWLSNRALASETDLPRSVPYAMSVWGNR